jgi:hypothetical protein
MKRHFFVGILFGVWALFFWFPATVQAKAVIEFTDGHRMVVTSYKEEGDKIRVYSSLGSFAFRKEDVAKIIDQGPSQQPRTTRTKPDNSVAKPYPSEAELNRQKVSPTTLVQAPSVVQQMQGGDLVELAMNGLARMRYVLGLIVFAKVAKLLFAASIR